MLQNQIFHQEVYVFKSFIELEIGFRIQEP